MRTELESKIGLAVAEGEALSNYTTFKIGGPAKFFVKVDSGEKLSKCVRAARELKLPFFILGGGSNVLISDKGFDGLAVKLEAGEIKIEDKGGYCLASAFSGCNLSDFIKKTIGAGFGGLEFSANIPGTVGGAIFGNAGAYGKAVGDFVESVEIIDVGDAQCASRVLSQEQCAFAYRESVFKKNKDWIIAEITFKLEKDDKAAERLSQIQKEYNERCAKQPLDFPSAGCSFKNVLFAPDLARYETWVVKGKIPAARFIEEAGLKGQKIGGAMVSDKHANFILNVGGAKADDVIQLISLIKMKVRDEFGVQLQEEVQYVGFN